MSTSPPVPGTSYVCDTLPAPRRLASEARNDSEIAVEAEPSVRFEVSQMELQDAKAMAAEPEVKEEPPSQPSPARKLCVRHQRMADEGTNLKLQKSLDALPVEDRAAVNGIWSTFSSSSHPRRALILHGLLTMCCFSQLSLLTENLAHLIRIDPFAVLPRELALNVLKHLDAISLCRAAQVSRLWRGLADDDILWRGICEQHIGQKCLKCGWGLPRLERKKTRRVGASCSPCPSPGISSSTTKRELDSTSSSLERPLKRRRSGDADGDAGSPTASTSTIDTAERPPDYLLAPSSSSGIPELATRPWKDVYSERLTIERNWRRERYTVRTLTGHTDGVMCLQYSETFAHPSFPILMTGSYDRTVRIWNLETGVQVAVLRGHTRAIRALQFDEAKLVTASMDHTLRVWDWRAGQCVRVLEGHSEGVVCLNFDSNVLASGGVDAAVKVWNFRTGEAFTLRGHRDWVNSVRLWDSEPNAGGVAAAPDGSILTAEAHTAPSSSAPQIDPGKMLFSASDDGTIRLWDLTTRTCVRQFSGHVSQVQTMKLLQMDDGCEDDRPSAAAVALPAPALASASSSRAPSVLSQSDDSSARGDDGPALASRPAVAPKRKLPVLVSGSLDNTIKLWDISTGKAYRTFFGHIEGVWAVACDKMRLVSGSNDRTIKVWNWDEGTRPTTLFGHRGAVACLALGEDKIVSGSDDGDVKVWSFAG